MGERNPLLVLNLTLVDFLVVPYAQDSLVYLEQELGLRSVVNRDTGPNCHTVFIIEVGACENSLELSGNRRSLYHFGESGRIDVVFHDDPVLLSIFIDGGEPFLHSVKKFYLFPETTEILSCKAYPESASLIEHEFHITQDVARVLLYCNVIAFGPEFLRVFPYSLDESEFLHVSRREGPVEVVNERNNWFLSHHIQIFTT